MAYTRSVREMALDEEPMASAIAAVMPDEEESPYTGEMRWDNATEDQLRLLRLHPGVELIVGPFGGNNPAVGDGGVTGVTE